MQLYTIWNGIAKNNFIIQYPYAMMKKSIDFQVIHDAETQVRTS